MKTKLILLGLTLAAFGCTSGNQSELEASWTKPISINTNQREGFKLKPNGEAESINMHTLIIETWKRVDNSIVFTGKSLGSGQTIEFIDTLEIEKLTATSLVLLRDGERLSFTKE